MNYETLDWKLEAARVAAAFRINEPCEFLPFFGIREPCEFDPYYEHGMSFNPTQRKGPYMEQPKSPKGSSIKVYYSREGRYYNCISSEDRPDSETEILLDWNGQIEESDCEFSAADLNAELVHALYCLDLLSPEVEAALGVSITAHEKLEWKLEYEARNRF